MNHYLIPIKQAIITFPLLALALTIPYLIMQYRKYGYVNKLRSVILYSLLLYSIVAYYLVILPLPKILHNCTDYGSIWSYMQLKPFSFVNDITRETNFAWNQFSSYVALLKERSFLQVIFNIILMIPLGIYLRYYFRFKFLGTVLSALLVSLFYEISQVTGLYGLYACPYRLFDVDDLILNTSGVVVGYLIAPILYYFLPRSDKLDEKINLNEVKVGFIRRGISFVVDLFVLMIISGLLSIVLYGTSSITLGATPNESAFFMLSSGIAVIIYFVVIPALFGGRTLGKWITRIHVVEDARRDSNKFITWTGLLKRYLQLYFGVFGTINLLVYISDYGDIPIEAVYAIRVVIIIILLVFAIHILWNMIKGEKRLFYERISGTRNVVTNLSAQDVSVENDSTSFVLSEGDTIKSLIEAERNNHSSIPAHIEDNENKVDQLEIESQPEQIQNDEARFNHSVPELHEQQCDDHSKQVEIELEKLKNKLAQEKKDKL
ncbi:VanZ family protein [Paenibacillus sp. GSMTC-2017]|uniref:VanZ family protein n=1 Tax=Paenibacillus sp. GSMTC-2017 TaxID=2794350 RepID=UPI0018D77280|nr:VanZ family protein [Paenibacillus sp. GSMTC-2017]MBH5318048.1 VanZ family protein [Paenibacillus sp. GSMTC-2017]